MSEPLITAVSHRWEAELAGRLDASPQVHLVRRCADLAELLGAVEAGLGRVAVISADLRGLDRSVIARLGEHGVRLLGVHAPVDDPGARSLRRWGVSVVIEADADQQRLEEAIAELLTGSEPDTADHLPETAPADLDGDQSGEAGQIVVVWGPAGAPGRTTVAVNLAAEIASAVSSAILVDADTYAASVAQVLAVLDEAPGVAAASRAADQGTLDRATLSRLAPQVLPGLRVLTGLPRADRWTELGEHALADVLAACQALAPVTVVDVASCLEQDEEVSFDTNAPRRNGATLTALAQASHVVVVGSGDPVGLHRLVRALDALSEVSTVPRTVVVTRVRASAVGADPATRVRQALYRFAGVTESVLVPDDRGALDAALLAGRVLKETRPTSPAREAIRALAAELTGTSVPRHRPRPRRRPAARSAEG